MARRAASDSESTKVLIVDSAFKLFGQNGYDGVSIDRISKACGLSKSAMYWHYDNKAKLFIACLERLDDIFRQHIFDPVKQESDPTRSVIVFFDGLNNLLLDKALTSSIAGFWLEPHGLGTEEIAAVQDQHDAARVEIAAETFRQGEASQQFDFSMDPYDLARSLIAVMEATILPLRRNEPEQNIKTLEFLMETFFKAYSRSG